jgi:predicted Zn-dependent peptidase
MFERRRFSLNLKVLIVLLAALSLFVDQEAFSWKNEPEKKILENGFTLIYQQDKSSALTALQIAIKGGKGAEPLEKSGLAHLTTRMALEIPDLGKVQDLMAQSSIVYMMGRGDYSQVNINCLSENLEKTLKVVSEIMLKPLLSGIRIDRNKERMREQRKEEEDDLFRAGHNALVEKLFAGSSYGGSSLGSEESLKAIKKKEIEDFHQSYFKGGNMIVVAISDLEKEPLFAILNKYLAQFPPGKAPESKPSLLSIPEDKKITFEKDTKQFMICDAFPLAKVTAKNYTLACLLENLLGKGVDSKLWPLRAREKLAYNVNCIATQMKDGGTLEAYLETSKEKKETALEALNKVLIDLFEKGITDEELNVTKVNLKSSFLRNNETKDARASTLSYFEALGLGLEFFNGFFSEIDAVIIEEMNVYIKDILNPEKKLEVIVGPKDESQKINLPQNKILKPLLIFN